MGSGRGEGELRVQTEQRVVERVSATGGGAARTDGAESVWRKGCCSGEESGPRRLRPALTGCGASTLGTAYKTEGDMCYWF